MPSIALNDLLTYLESLNLSSSNKRWLADHFFEAKPKKGNVSDEAFFEELLSMPNGDERSASEIMKDIRAARPINHLINSHYFIKTPPTLSASRPLREI